MPSFVQTINPTPYGVFDSDTTFQNEADKITTWVRRRLGDDVLSVELTSKQIWSALEEATFEYTRLVHEFRIKSELVNALGQPTGSDYTNRYPRQTLEFILRMAEPYSTAIGLGGSTPAPLGYFDLSPDRQDYNFYTELKDLSGSLVYPNTPTGSRGRLKIVEVFHFEPLAAQHYLLNASNLTNFLASEFNYESYTNSTVFYVLPVFEDVLRRTMIETAFRVRRSNYSYQIIGGSIRIFPIPSAQRLREGAARLYVRYQEPAKDRPYEADTGVYQDDTVYGVSGINNFPFSHIPFNTINEPGRQWIRQMALVISMEMLGQIRSKMSTIPIPGNELRLNGPELLQQAQSMRDRLYTDFKELLSDLTLDKMLERQATQAEALARQLRLIPFKTAIKIG